METTTHEYYVSPEVAELLKKAGFDWLTRYSYDLYLYNTEGEKRVIDGFASTFCNKHNGLASMPTIEVAQRWLREVKNAVLLVDFNNDEDCEENERYGVTIYIGKERIIELATYHTYEEAQEAGIKKALEIILEKGE